jgi:hypothetical protein
LYRGEEDEYDCVDKELKEDVLAYLKRTTQRSPEHSQSLRKSDILLEHFSFIALLFLGDVAAAI